MELYDYFDKDGKKLGVATWKELHKKGLIHKNVHGILFKDKSKKQILLKKRSSLAEIDPNTIEIAVGGHILSGESPEEGLKREFKEEIFPYTPFKNISIKAIGSYFNNDVINNNEIAYIFQIICPGPFSYDKKYSDEPFWVDWNELMTDINVHPEKYAKYSINAISEYSKLTGNKRVS